MDPVFQTEKGRWLSYSTLMRKHYPASFKARVVLDTLQEKKTIAELAAEYGIHPTLIHKWRKTAVDNLHQVFSGEENAAALQDKHEKQVDELYSEIGRLTAQLSWLKKKGISIE